VIPRLLYGAAFAVVLPLLLVLWGTRLDRLLVLPIIDSPAPGLVLALGGVGLMLWAMRDLWIRGGGLPMSPFPPRRLVTGGVYRLAAHPIYIGAVLLTLGISLALPLAAGLWVVTPVLALAAAAWVLGYERAATRSRFGATPSPILRLPPDEATPPTVADRVSIYLMVLLPWLAAYMSVEFLGTPRDAVSAYLPWDRQLPVVPWTEGIYALTYVVVVLAPLVAWERRVLRRMALRGLWATALIIPFYLVVPIVAQSKPVTGSGFWQSLLRWERLYDQPVTAFPAFHVIWAWIAAAVFIDRWPRLKWVWWGVVAAVAASCVATGMHAVLDVAAGLAACLIIAQGPRLWRLLCRGAEWVANSWRETTVGPVRFLSHGVFASLGAVTGLVIAGHLAGPAGFGWLLGMWAAAVVGAGLWAQVVEGSPQLLRPYGYFGGVVGALLVLLAAVARGADVWVIFAAFGVGATVTQALGRLRCLVQGCCHGREAPAWLGIRYTDPRSRVVRLAHWEGVPLHPTQLYSILWTLFAGVLMWRLWALAAPLPFICGSYFILVGAGRFVEEHYRGEPQTPVHGGFRLYQWLAIVFVLGGAALTALGARPAPPPGGLSTGMIGPLLAVAVATYFAYGVDLPAGKLRFSRLT
jgi:protein-S-isoprenylcysteine O-methyltransferase Ste14